jgi:hypothetical protein
MYDNPGKKVKWKVQLLCFPLVRVEKDQMTQLVALGLQIALVMGIWAHFEGEAFDDIESVPAQADHLFGIIR